jgi:hypothetical protein
LVEQPLDGRQSQAIFRTGDELAHGHNAILVPRETNIGRNSMSRRESAQDAVHYIRVRPDCRLNAFSRSRQTGWKSGPQRVA